MGPVHRRRDEEGHLGVVLASLVHDGAELSQDWLNAMRDWRRRSIFQGREEVCDARQDAYVGLLSQLQQCLGQDFDVTARQHLGRLHQRIRPAINLVQMASDVRIPNHGEATERHHEAAEETGTRASNFQSSICVHVLLETIETSRL